MRCDKARESFNGIVPRGRSKFSDGAGPFAVAAHSALQAAHANSSAAPQQLGFVAKLAATQRNAGTGRKFGQFAGSRALGSIERFELFPEQPLRPSIRDQVMRLDDEHMIVLAKPQQLDSKRRLSFNVELSAQQFRACR